MISSIGFKALSNQRHFCFIKLIFFYNKSSDEGPIISRRKPSSQDGMLDFIELSKLVEDLGNDQVVRHNGIKLRDLAKDTSVNLERPPQLYPDAVPQHQEQHLCLSTCNKNNKARSPSQIPILRGHVDIECCYCFHKQKTALEQKQGKTHCELVRLNNDSLFLYFC